MYGTHRTARKALYTDGPFKRTRIDTEVHGYSFFCTNITNPTNVFCTELTEAVSTRNSLFYRTRIFTEGHGGFLSTRTTFLTNTDLHGCSYAVLKLIFALSGRIEVFDTSMLAHDAKV